MAPARLLALNYYFSDYILLLLCFFFEMSAPLPETDLESTQPSHGHPTEHAAVDTPPQNREATASHPPPSKPDPTTTSPPGSTSHTATASKAQDAAQGELPSSAPTSSTELARLKVDLRSALRQFPDFPSPGVLFEDIMPLFYSHTLHTSLIRALELQIADVFNTTTGEKSGVDVVVGLESRGFLFGPTLALRLGAGFVSVRKKGKLPGPCETESFQKEYGADHFQMQSDAIKRGQKVVVIDDIIATGESLM